MNDTLGNRLNFQDTRTPMVDGVPKQHPIQNGKTAPKSPLFAVDAMSGFVR